MKMVQVTNFRKGEDKSIINVCNVFDAMTHISPQLFASVKILITIWRLILGRH
jgi:hypothetical protein